MTFTQDYRDGLAQGIDYLELGDAVNECPHGRMPGYQGHACNCWAVLAPVVPLPVPMVLKAAA